MPTKSAREILLRECLKQNNKIIQKRIV